MSYEAQSNLEGDHIWQERNRCCCVQQAHVYKDDTRANWVALANGVLRDDGGYTATFTRLNSAAPGFADAVDQTGITDEQILSATQANWPTVAGLYFNEDGTPLGG